MTLDMANFSIGVIKPDIVACTVEYEKKHFKQLLETQPGIKSFFQNLYYLYNISKFFSLLAYSALQEVMYKIQSCFNPSIVKNDDIRDRFFKNIFWSSLNLKIS